MSSNIYVLIVLSFCCGLSRAICSFNGSSLDCSNRNITDGNIHRILMASIAPSRITDLDLSSNFLENIQGSLFKAFTNLEILRLSNNRIKSVEEEAFTHMPKLVKLFLRHNELKHVPSAAIKHLQKLKKLDLRSNPLIEILNDSFSGMRSLENLSLFEIKKSKPITRIHIGAFRNMKSLQELLLHVNNITLSAFPDLKGTNMITTLSLRSIDKLIIPKAFCDHKKLIHSIFVGYCNMTSFPSLNRCRSLELIDFFENNIGFIPDDAFSGLPYIKNIEIWRKQNTVGSVHKDAFSYLPSLQELDLSHVALENFPNLNGTNHLRWLKLPKCDLKWIPSHLCHNMQELNHLDLSSNNIKVIPSLSGCSSLSFLDLSSNKLTRLNKELYGLKRLDFLDLSDNILHEVNANIFRETVLIRTLSLQRNMIQTIHINAFKYIQNIQVLDLSFNHDLKALPVEGLQSLRQINVRGNKRMTTFPTQEDLPHAVQLSLVYEYHCCFFLRNVQQIQDDKKVQGLSKSSYEIVDHKFSKELNVTQKSIDEIGDIEPMLRMLNNGTPLIFIDEKPNHQPAVKNFDEAFCTPSPNAFYPCEDLMGKQWLRVCVWIVFLFATVGNIAVLVVSFANCHKLDVPRYLIVNLAFADLCLAVYLGFLAFVDMKTLGDFRSHALDWQFSGSCQTAGFLAVFAAELSVYTLTVITIERFTTIKYSMHVELRMKRRHAFYVMGLGWIFAITAAALPLNTIGGVKFSDYSKYSVCLPFDKDDMTSKVYVVFLLSVNLLAFVIILACYVKIYFFINGSNAWNSGDSRVARRMAILVFTDFLCWFPIVLTALTAVFDQSLLPSLWTSKVLAVFVFPLNACANPFLYAILTKQFRKDVSCLFRNIKEKSGRNSSVRRSLLRMPIKGSLTYSTSVRRGSSCSFLFGRRCSSKTADEIRFHAREVIRQQQTDEEQQLRSEEEQKFEGERLTSV